MVVVGGGGVCTEEMRGDKCPASLNPGDLEIGQGFMGFTLRMTCRCGPLGFGEGGVGGVVEGGEVSEFFFFFCGWCDMYGVGVVRCEMWRGIYDMPLLTIIRTYRRV